MVDHLVQAFLPFVYPSFDKTDDIIIAELGIKCPIVYLQVHMNR